MNHKHTLLLSLPLFALACGGGGSEPGPDAAPITCTTPLAERYMPLKTGASWTYEITEVGKPAESKTTSVEAFEDVGDRKAGTIAFRMNSAKTVGHTISWLEDRCTEVVRHREQSYSEANVFESDQFYVPGKLRVDETAAHTTVGASWTLSYSEVEVDPVAGTTKTVSKDETWTVLAVDESLTTPAGTFACLKVGKVTSGAANKTFWFAKGVGKVREEGEQTEVLTAYTIP